MLRVKIFGAGSIGNHLAHASRQLGWDVTVCDVSNEALERMRGEIYPSRYGAWDPTIKLLLNRDAPQGKSDLIMIGTPPEAHLPLARQALGERPRAILIEKPLCTPSLDLAQTVYETACRSETAVFVGYDHVVGKATRAMESYLGYGLVGDVRYVDVEFREHWAGIFQAHPWLDGPADTYLGYWRRGGGASGEHSHALNLWQHLAHVLRKGRVAQVDAQVTYEAHDRGSYDSQCFLQLRTEGGLVGRVVQDVVTQPPQKRVRVQGAEGCLELAIGFEPNCDALLLHRKDGSVNVQKFPKTRPDDFLQELTHIHAHLDRSRGESPISLNRGLDTMLVVAAAHRAELEQRRMGISYHDGYVPDAINACASGADVSLKPERAVA
ncbi:MAG: Gfo/Idh/MocA family oxidoreductase [Planctomycetes bacterium]|nr:Gfo/Idh/MocA family oxidoreductase [Planctomycetota bacterium]